MSLGKIINGLVVGKFDGKSILDGKSISTANSDEKVSGRQGIIVGGNEYGKMDNKILDALDDFYKDTKVVVALSFQEEHRKELIYRGIIPFQISRSDDYKTFRENDKILIEDLDLYGDNCLYIENKNIAVPIVIKASQQEKDSLKQMKIR